MSSVLVTGGAGFIGSHTCIKLLENKYDVFVIDSFYKTSSETLIKIQKYINKNYPNYSNKLYFFEGDIKNQILIDKVFTKAKELDKKINSVIHFAGFKSVYDSIYNPILYWDNNLGGTISLLKSMYKNDCKILVFSSSATIYDANNSKMIKEDTNINPINPYGKTKAAIESLLIDTYHSNKNKWRIANLRYFNPVGAHPDAFIGEDINGEVRNLFPNIIQVAKGLKDFVSIYGNDWPSLDGTCIRDYIHVMDIAEAHMRTLNYLYSKKSEFINLNLGTGIGKSVLEVIKTFEETNKVSIPYLFKSRRQGDRARLVADIELSRSPLLKASLISLIASSIVFLGYKPNSFLILVDEI